MLRPATIVALSLVGLLAVSACSATTVGGESAGREANTTKDSDADDTRDIDSDDGSDASGEPSSDRAMAEQCLHGRWFADNDYFLSAMQEFGDGVVSVTGQVTITFNSDSTVSTEYADWVITSAVNGAGSTILRDGVDTGVYSVSNGFVTIEETDIGSRMSVTAAGTEIAITPDPAVYTDAALSCAESSATITTHDGTLELNRN